jgi:hypothetical protein
MVGWVVEHVNGLAVVATAAALAMWLARELRRAPVCPPGRYGPAPSNVRRLPRGDRPFDWSRD